jgi:rubrerythrin
MTSDDDIHYRVCLHCGHYLRGDPGDRLCPRCGRVLLLECSACGHAIENFMAKSCPRCGARYRDMGSTN